MEWKKIHEFEIKNSFMLFFHMINILLPSSKTWNSWEFFTVVTKFGFFLFIHAGHRRGKMRKAQAG